MILNSRLEVSMICGVFCCCLQDSSGCISSTTHTKLCSTFRCSFLKDPCLKVFLPLLHTTLKYWIISVLLCSILFITLLQLSAKVVLNCSVQSTKWGTPPKKKKSLFWTGNKMLTDFTGSDSKHHPPMIGKIRKPYILYYFLIWRPYIYIHLHPFTQLYGKASRIQQDVCWVTKEAF